MIYSVKNFYLARREHISNVADCGMVYLGIGAIWGQHLILLYFGYGLISVALGCVHMHAWVEMARNHFLPMWKRSLCSSALQSMNFEFLVRQNN